MYINLYIAAKQNQSPKAKVNSQGQKSRGWPFFGVFLRLHVFQVLPLFIMKKGGNAGNVGRPPGGQSTEKQRKAMKVAIERIKDWPPARRSTP